MSDERENVTAVRWGTYCLRGGGHINVDGACGSKGPRLFVEVEPTDSPAEVAGWIRGLQEMFDD